jgi:hypothetical protein
MGAKRDFPEQTRQDYGAIYDEAREAPKHREIRESKPVREWTVAERREAPGIESERVEAGIVEEWELCIDCHENKCEQGFSW